jgi:hypothetical protein
MAVRRGYSKHPDAELDYGFRVRTWLAGDGIDATEWTVSTVGGDPNPLVGSDDFADGTKVGIWLRGGTHGNLYTITCQLTTDSTPARVKLWSLDILVSNDVSV